MYMDLYYKTLFLFFFRRKHQFWAIYVYLHLEFGLICVEGELGLYWPSMYSMYVCMCPVGKEKVLETVSLWVQVTNELCFF